MIYTVFISLPQTLWSWTIWYKFWITDEIIVTVTYKILFLCTNTVIKFERNDCVTEIVFI
jgi:hypothetical protein